MVPDMSSPPPGPGQALSTVSSSSRLSRRFGTISASFPSLVFMIPSLACTRPLEGFSNHLVLLPSVLCPGLTATTFTVDASSGLLMGPAPLAPCSEHRRTCLLLKLPPPHPLAESALAEVLSLNVQGPSHSGLGSSFHFNLLPPPLST